MWAKCLFSHSPVSPETNGGPFISAALSRTMGHITNPDAQQAVENHRHLSSRDGDERGLRFPTLSEGICCLRKSKEKADSSLLRSSE
jgi:hypothetical protein